jgi:hypothetical protein
MCSLQGTWSGRSPACEPRGRLCAQEARAIYKRCYSKRLEEDGHVRLCAGWIRFEQEEGSADDYLQAVLKAEPIIEESVLAVADAAAAAAAQVRVEIGG